MRALYMANARPTKVVTSKTMVADPGDAKVHAKATRAADSKRPCDDAKAACGCRSTSALPPMPTLYKANACPCGTGLGGVALRTGPCR